MSSPLLSLSGLSKRFLGVQALDDVGISVQPGEVHGLLGENGAGKSTLLKIISGAQPPDAGTMLWDGADMTAPNPLAAQALGIVTIYQEFNLVPTLTVAENIFIGREPTRMGLFVDWPKMRSMAREQLDRIGLAIDPGIPVSALSVAEQQMVEIARALSMKARLVVMDEPTSALTETEVERLIAIMRQLRDEGVSILFVTHRLEEAMQICDRFTVLRDGKLAGVRERRGLTIPQIIELMVGRSASDLYRRPERRHEAGAVRLSTRDLSTARSGRRSHGTVLRGINLDVRAGEILGIAGLVGAGRTEFARAVFGADPLAAGEIRIDGRPASIRSPRDAIRHGIGLVPEDRKQQALFLDLAIRQNFSIAGLERFSTLGVFVDEAAEGRALDGFRRSMHVRMRDPGQRVGALSGGNQQKIVLARWLQLEPKILIVDEPTRGVDIGAKAEVHELLDQLAARGVAVIAISSDLPEVMAISDRIVTMRAGRITGEVSANDATQERLMTLMTLEQRDAA
ncbi:sugar ABC transporter ATP-binding protein [Labrys wisconsinensis]|uniref:Inositol transport system ATP-binding protein n=1 Tax=Labrys wisconsinensis TaxID=425677 RepID=A0ABU0J252_9HYPH|nr:sugar ABC transporter ATP-binding protein [Labrys wisconsinensis]MDQ0467399.1 inositol transport system ATP-binding protein [Labrys wisconsinensis]